VVLWTHTLSLSHCPYRSESREVTLNTHTLSLPLSVPSGVKGGFIVPLLYVILTRSYHKSCMELRIAVTKSCSQLWAPWTAEIVANQF
jgi:hypothetical protein